MPTSHDAPPDLGGVLETALYVADLERSIAFYRRVFGWRPLVHDERMAALNVVGRQVLLLFRRGGSVTPSVLPGGTIPPHDGAGQLHVAFAIPAEALDPWRERLGAENVAIESEVQFEAGGRSLYFRDPDGHLLELATPGLWSIY